MRKKKYLTIQFFPNKIIRKYHRRFPNFRWRNSRAVVCLCIGKPTKFSRYCWNLMLKDLRVITVVVAELNRLNQKAIIDKTYFPTYQSRMMLLKRFMIT